MTSKEQAKIEIERLVERFEDHKLDYKQAGYNETQTRRDFIDPFFKALGWDIDNTTSASEAYRDVIHEDKVRIENKLKSPDYSFRLNGKRCFFVEAKKPSVNVKDDVDPAYQVKRYAWSAKLKLSIVTDFEEFAIYDCSSKPKPTDKASVARIDYFKCTDYINKFDFIWDTFSKVAVQSGGYDKFVNKDKKKGTTSVDDDFLESLDLWRTALAKDIFKNNSKLSEDHLNHVVQHTIDRIIFLRIAEDRNIEVYGAIQNCLKEKGSAYKALYQLFLNAHDKYNSGLFDFDKDKISQGITISDKCLSEIIDNLYFPSSPYEFSVIPVEILGSAYEQFLGKTIQIKNGKINVDEKPEVRKAGGVYYTPQYIVDYIVQNTVGKLIENKTPKEIEKIKVLDPASGSGSFLLGAYDYLLKYHHDWYAKNASQSKGKKSDPLNPDGSLTTDVKKRILLNNIYGVDIDANAVEVTKLSLLLKCLEGETQASIQSQMTLFNERVLPTLDQNIKCGNSLVSTDFFEMEPDVQIRKKVNPFNWQIEFKNVFKQGGFDVVIGNPPYVDSRLNTTYLKDYCKERFISFSAGKTNIYEVFLESGLQHLNNSGCLSFIIPIVLLNIDSCAPLRKYLIDRNLFDEISYCDEAVFKDVNVDTMVLKLNKKNSFQGDLQIKKYNFGFVEIANSQKIPFDELLKSAKIVLKNDAVSDVIIKSKYKTGKLSEYMNFYNGIATGPGKEKFIATKKINKSYKKLIMGNDIARYRLNYSNRFINYERSKLHRPRDEMIFLVKEKIVMQRIRNLKLNRRLISAFDNEQFYTFNSVNNLIIKESSKYNIRYFVGLLNSKLINHVFKSYSLNTNITASDLDRLPIREINDDIKPEKQAHDKIVSHVNKLLELNKSAEPDQKQIQHYENQIDKLVYELYGLTEDEIKIIEEATSGNS